ncbi:MULTISPECIES: hypothetical protein [unclassified Okeania]|uniref:hypothetical protein n=1 Tax=unclassified Okeania TaxID=2634635 RepID=UPI0013BF53FD|nr:MULTISPECIES: hypothetical protein [unclassified Okeania]NEN89089.1 hypothetical protein [Okeania sp. SIO3H1]NET29351.1 hypothetical protein [Okeania sp. SIO1I7]NET42310.1 hypothetical protein [Okeania sp. SIO2B3]
MLFAQHDKRKGRRFFPIATLFYTRSDATGYDINYLFLMGLVPHCLQGTNTLGGVRIP